MPIHENKGLRMGILYNFIAGGGLETGRAEGLGRGCFCGVDVGRRWGGAA
jgi:hypothetical protein